MILVFEDTFILIRILNFFLSKGLFRILCSKFFSKFVFEINRVNFFQIKFYKNFVLWENWKIQKHWKITKIQKYVLPYFHHVRIASAAYEKSHSECRSFRMKKNLSNKIFMSALFQIDSSLFHMENFHWTITSITHPLRHTIRRPTEDGTRI